MIQFCVLVFIKVLALRVSFVGELGWELHIANESLVAVYRAVMEAGLEFGVVNASYRAIDALSIEKGYPHWHQEIKYVNFQYFLLKALYLL